MQIHAVFGGRVFGEAALPVGITDCAAALLQAQSSGAKVITLAGSNLLNRIADPGVTSFLGGSSSIRVIAVWPDGWDGDWPMLHDAKFQIYRCRRS